MTPGGDDPVVEVLLSTYNGERHLDAFLQSLIDQDFPNWRLIVRDDGSSDGTLQVLSRWIGTRPGQIRISPSGPAGNVGVVRSFSSLLQASEAPYVMLADQDDVWLPEKVSLTLGALRARERASGSDRPVLVHTDLRVVDDELNVLNPSFWSYQGLAPGKPPVLPRLMIENVVWGCTAMLNRALIEKVGDIPGDLPHHDWWIGLVAAAFGELVSLRAPSILWRRHGLNASGISSISALPSVALEGLGGARDRLDAVMIDARQRAGRFLERYRDELTEDQIGAAEALLALPQRSYIQRRRDLLRHGLLFASPVRNAALLALI